MNALVPAVEITAERIDRARTEMAATLRDELDDVVERGAHLTVALPGYSTLTVEQVRPNTRRAMTAVLNAVETGDPSLFGEILFGVSYQRARQGLPVHALFDVIRLTEQLLREIAAKCLHGLHDVVAGFEVSRALSHRRIDLAPSRNRGRAPVPLPSRCRNRREPDHAAQPARRAGVHPPRRHHGAPLRLSACSPRTLGSSS